MILRGPANGTGETEEQKTKNKKQLCSLIFFKNMLLGVVLELSIYVCKAWVLMARH
jgi:hypothetical protein